MSDVDRVDDLQLRRVMAVASGMAMEMRMCEELKEKGQRLYIHRANRSIARLGSGYALVVVTYDHGDTPVVRNALGMPVA